MDCFPGLDFEFPQLLLYVRPTSTTIGTFRFKETGDFGLAVFTHENYIRPYQLLLGRARVLVSQITFEGAIEIVKIQPFLDCLILLDEILNPRIYFVKSSTE